MSHPRAEQHLPAEQDSLRTSLHQLSQIYNLDGYGIEDLEISIVPRAAQSCLLAESVLTITVDPYRLVNSPEDTSVQPIPEPHPQYVLYKIAHALGQATDSLDPAYHTAAGHQPAEGFFWDVIDSTVIDTRNRQVSLLDDSIDELYANVLFPMKDITHLPRHAQLMCGLMLATVTRNQLPAIDQQVGSNIQSLSAYTKGGRTFNVLDVLTDPRTTLADRRRIARRLILPIFEALLKEDGHEGQDNTAAEITEETDDFHAIYKQYAQAVHGHQGEATDEKSTQTQQPPVFLELTKQLTQTLIEAAETCKATSPHVQMHAMERGLDTTMQHDAQLTQLAIKLGAEMQLNQSDTESYIRTIVKWTDTIRDMAAVFEQLAAPSDVKLGPRYKSRAYTEGRRFHPQAMTAVAMAIQSATGQNQAIWQRTERRARRQAITFGGLDIHLIVDVTASMEGPKARCAAATALCLIEGLQLARHSTTRRSGHFQQPDVRLQIIAFGHGTETVVPLGHQPTDLQKGKTYASLLHPTSTPTLVSGALIRVQQAAKLSPKRDTIAIIVSDGEYHDHSNAVHQINTMPISVYPTELTIGAGNYPGITKNREVISNPRVLPDTTQRILAGYVRRYTL